jgi:hypothetical protein
MHRHGACIHAVVKDIQESDWKFGNKAGALQVHQRNRTRDLHSATDALNSSVEWPELAAV